MIASPNGFGARALVKLAALCGLVCGALQLVMISSAFAQSVSQSSPMIFDVRKSLPLEPTEPVYHDFYINQGPEAGFRKGMFALVVRQVPVHDPVLNKQQATLNISVARLHVIHVERGLTVARLHSEFGDEERPTLEYEAVMIGDRIDTTSLTMEAPKAAKKKSKVAEVSESLERPATAQPKTATAAAPSPAETVTIPVPAPAAEPSASLPGVLPASAPQASPPVSLPLGPSKSTAIPDVLPAEIEPAVVQKIAFPSEAVTGMVRPETGSPAYVTEPNG